MCGDPKRGGPTRGGPPPIRPPPGPPRPKANAAGARAVLSTAAATTRTAIRLRLILSSIESLRRAEPGVKAGGVEHRSEPRAEDRLLAASAHQGRIGVQQGQHLVSRRRRQPENRSGDSRRLERLEAGLVGRSE